ncbi:hypothetical protein AB205_0017380, partial [Aquarana catesbeiana]
MMELLTGESGNLRDSKVEVKEEITEEEDEEDGMTEESESPKEHKDLHQDTMVESSSYRSPPGRCSLYSGDSTQESPTKPHHHQSGSLRDYNIVVKEEYTDEDDEYGMFGELSEGRKGHYKNIMMKSPPTEISTGSAIKKPSKEHPTLWKMEDEDITQDCAVEKKISSTMDGGAHSVDRPSNPSDSDLARTVGDADKIQEQKKFSCSECGELFSSDLILSIYRSFHEGDKLHFCSECGKGFVCKSELVEHSKSHTGEKPFACTDCGKRFSQKSYLSAHQKLHMGEKPYSCPQCGKCFVWKSELLIHHRTHTGEKPYSCPECGKC